MGQTRKRIVWKTKLTQARGGGLDTDKQHHKGKANGKKIR